ESSRLSSNSLSDSDTDESSTLRSKSLSESSAGEESSRLSSNSLEESSSSFFSCLPVCLAGGVADVAFAGGDFPPPGFGAVDFGAGFGVAAESRLRSNSSSSLPPSSSDRPLSAGSPRLMPLLPALAPETSEPSPTESESGRSGISPLPRSAGDLLASKGTSS